jgi:GntR family transcriptional repressor for pyruvate dehydrogenase complex
MSVRPRGGRARVSEKMTRKLKQSKDTALKRAAAILRAEALRLAPGDPLGSEDELLTRFKLSRPTLRQAARLVVQEQLIEVRQGGRGGYIATRPTSGAVTHMASIYLDARGAGLDAVNRSTGPVRVELARQAAQRADEAARSELRDFLEREHKFDVEGMAFRDFLRAEREFAVILGHASGNDVLGLFLEILYDLAGRLKPEQDVYMGRPDRIAEYRIRRNWIAEAILQKDEELAALASQRCNSSIAKWMAEDHIQPVNFNAARSAVELHKPERVDDGALPRSQGKPRARSTRAKRDNP